MKLGKIISEKKKRGFVTIHSNSTVREAAETMCSNGVGALLVVDPEKGEKYAGIVSERDILRLCCTEDDFRTKKIADIMTRDVIVASVDDELEYTMRIMKNRHIRHMPVIDKENVVGMISIRDIVNSMLEEQNIRVRHLSDYMPGTSHSDVY